MTNPLQLLRDFRKKREKRYYKALKKVLRNMAEEEYEDEYPTVRRAYYFGLLDGIERRKEILKRVKI